MSSGPYFKQLGSQPGVMVSLDDSQERAAELVSDQVAATVAKLERGPIDRAFMVTRESADARMGPVRSNLVRAIYEARMQVADALDQGAAGVVVARLSTPAATKRYATVHLIDRVTRTYASGPYPAYVVEAIEPAFGLSGGDFGMPMQMEAIDVGFGMTGGSFPQVVFFGNYSIEPEAVGVNFGVTGGSFPIVVHYFANTIAPEAVDVGFSLSSGSFPLVVRYLTNTIEPEAVAVGFGITNGTLT